METLVHNDKRLLERIVIPGYVTVTFRESLEYGIDEATIYPDLEGLKESRFRTLAAGF